MNNQWALQIPAPPLTETYPPWTGPSDISNILRLILPVITILLIMGMMVGMMKGIVKK